MKKRVLSLLLVMLLVFSLLPAAAMAADAEPTVVSQNTADTDDGALHMKKSLLKNADGTYDIRIESWATGEVDSQVVNEAVPTDFVLILDQSGSMDTRDMPASYDAVAGPWTPNRVMDYNQTLYCKVTNEDGTESYYPVGVKDIPTGGLSRISPRVRDFGRNTGTRITATINGNNVYAMDSTGAIYQVYRDTTAFLIYHNSEFYYFDAYGNRQAVDSQAWWGAWDLATNPSLNANNLYTMSGNNHAYGLYYKDGGGNESSVADSQTVSAAGNTFYSGELYTTTGQMKTRLQALKDAVSGFVTTVQEKAESDGVNHRIAIVGFASDGTNYNNTAWENTELLTGVNVSGTSGRAYNRITDTDYQNALQDVTTSAGRTDLTRAIDAIDGEGGTQAQYGFNMANNILSKRQVTTYVNQLDQTADRNTVVLFFTDGHPGNYDTDDTITAANSVVAAAKPVKQNAWKTKVFSVGIFASGDDQPLTFALDTSRMSNSQQQAAMSRDNYIRYSDGWLYFRGNKVTQTPYNDTISDYMTCVSSKYPAADNFLTHSGGTADTGAQTNARGAENQDHVDYYMRVTDASGLQKAFEAVANSVDTSSTSATVDSSAVLRDTVYTGDFDVSGASAEAKSVAIKTVDGEVVETGAAGTASPVVTDSVSSNGRLSVTNFDYSALYTDSSKEGEKLVVTIKNVEPKKGGHLWSNSGDASIYPAESSSDAVLGVASPDENIARISHVIDFNAPMTFAAEMKRWKPVNEITNGEYKISDGNFTYQLLPAQSLPTDNKDQVTLVMSDVDTALALSNDVVWTQYTAIPANNIYFDDVLRTGDAIDVGDGSGYNENVTTDVSSGAGIVNENGAEVYYFTFRGTGIDVYCTTAAEDGSVQVSLVRGDHFDNANKVYVEDADGKYVLNEETGAYELATADTPADAQRYSTSSYAVINMSQTTRYNVPTVTYMDLPYDTYTVYLKAMKGCEYKLDGVRIYNALGAPDTLSQEVYSNTDEANARFYTLREGLVNDGEDVNVTATATNPTTGVLFVDDPDKLYMKDGDGNDFYPDMNAAYKANSPKNEIYLGSGEAIAFNVNGVAGAKYWVGLSVPEEGAESAVVNVNGTTTTVTSAVDMYYPIEPNDGAVTITNNGDAMVSVTKLKVTSPYSAPDAVPDDTKMEPFSVITPKLLRMLANQGVDTQAGVDQPSQDDAVASMKALIKQLISDFVRTLFQSISQLFGK